MRKPLAAALLTLLSALPVQAQCAVDNSLSPPQMRCVVNLEGFTHPNFKVPLGAEATPSSGGYQGRALACRGTDFFNIMLDAARRKDRDAVVRELTKVYREGFCLELPAKHANHAGQDDHQRRGVSGDS